MSKHHGKVSRCHYCGAKAGTRDHIVPRSRALYLGSAARDNIVPSCASCNQRKGSKRSDCGCMKCLLAWEKYGPDGWRREPVIALVQMEVWL